MSSIARGWRKVLAGTLAALAIALAGPTAVAKARETLRISIVVYNYANVSPAILAEAQHVVNRIYGNIGVEPSWIVVTTSQIQGLADDPRLLGAFQAYPIYVGLRAGMAEQGRR